MNARDPRAPDRGPTLVLVLIALFVGFGWGVLFATQVMH